MSKRKEAWRTIVIFLAIVTVASTLFHYVIVNLYPSRICIGGLMWCPAVATVITLKLNGKYIYSINWSWGD
jgi:hypothetical protein